MDKNHEITVRIDAPSSPLVERAFSILQDRIQRRCPSRFVSVERDGQIVLALDGDLAPEGFSITADGAAVRVAGGTPRGLLYGIGKYLRTSGFGGPDGAGFSPSGWRGVSVPQGSLRGMYFASHFHNWYHEAPEAEIARYVEDLALWGVNCIHVCFPFIDLQNWDDPQAAQASAMLRKFARITQDAGLQFGLMSNNTLYRGIPDHLRAASLPDPTGRRGNSGHPVCPSLPDGRALILENYRRLFDLLADIGLDVITHWPYDEGGCACERCRPWGSNGYITLSHDLTRLGREYFPDLKTVLSTWMFDTPPEGEWQGLADELDRDGGWVDAILADSHEDFPRYPLENRVPGGVPLLNFPEISMWGNWPWGGAGANPLPGRFQALWDQVRGAVSGGLPYSEGIYEDLNKAVVAQFYWDRDRSAAATLAEYLAYEFGPQAGPEGLELIRLLETAAANFYQRLPVDPGEARRAAALAETIHRRLPDWGRHGWRWEILYLRALIDRERFAGGGLETPAAEAAMARLVEIYHCQMDTADPYHHRVRPPLRGAISRCGEL